MPHQNPPVTELMVERFTAIAENFTRDFGVPAISDDDYLRKFAENVMWYDHAFQVVRVGRPAIAGLRKAFLHCNQPFKATVKAIYPNPAGVVVEQVWKGCCTNDIVRPDGQVAVKATGKDFETHVCMVLRINDSEKIDRIDEYYHKFWDEGQSEQQYVKMTGASIQDAA